MDNRDHGYLVNYSTQESSSVELFEHNYDSSDPNSLASEIKNATIIEVQVFDAPSLAISEFL